MELGKTLMIAGVIVFAIVAVYWYGCGDILYGIQFLFNGNPSNVPHDAICQMHNCPNGMMC